MCSSDLAVGAALGGLLDDRLGSKPVIVGALIAMITVAVTLLSLAGPAAFWVCGLLLCLFIGPVQASARTLMLEMTYPPPVADMLLTAYAAAVGLPALVTSTVQDVTGVPARSFHDWAVDHAADFVYDKPPEVVDAT